MQKKPDLIQAGDYTVTRDQGIIRYTGNDTSVIIPSEYKVIHHHAFENKIVEELTADNTSLRIRNRGNASFSADYCGLNHLKKLHILYNRLPAHQSRALCINRLLEGFPKLQELEIILANPAPGEQNTRVPPITLYETDGLDHPVRLVLNANAMNAVAHVFHPERMLFERNLLFVCSEEDTDLLTPEARKLLSIAFLRNPEHFKKPEIYLDWFRRNGVSFFTNALKYQDTECLLQLLNHPGFQGFTAQTYDSLIRTADSMNLVEVKAMLMDSYHHFYDAEKEQARKERKLLRQILNPFNAESMAKIWTWGPDGDGLRLLRYRPAAQNGSKSPQDIMVPPYIGKKAVTLLAPELFKNLSIREIVFPDTVHTLTTCIFFRSRFTDSFTVPDSIQAISEQAFREARVSQVILPEHLEKIGERAFSKCSLNGIRIPESVTEMGAGVFYGCQELRKVSLPGSMREIPADFFFDCAKLTDVVVPSGCETVGVSSFRGTPSLDRFSLPESVTVIARDAFMLSGVRSMNLEHVEVICENAFGNCKNLSEARLTRARVLGSRAFYQSGVTYVSAPKVISIESHTFSGCKNLTEADISGAIQIGVHAFDHCSVLRRVYLSGDLRIVSDNAFLRCSALEQILFPQGTDLDRMRYILRNAVPQTVQIMYAEISR